MTGGGGSAEQELEPGEALSQQRPADAGVGGRAGEDGDGGGAVGDDLGEEVVLRRGELDLLVREVVVAGAEGGEAAQRGAREQLAQRGGDRALGVVAEA